MNPAGGYIPREAGLSSLYVLSLLRGDSSLKTNYARETQPLSQNATLAPGATQMISST